MLPARLLRPPGRQLLARSPNATPPLLLRSRIRAFHATAPRNNVVLDTVLYLPHELITMIHTQVPWYAALPLTAFVVRGLLVTTAGNYVRALTARYVGIHPVRQALANQKRSDLMLRGGFSNPKQAKKAIANAIKQETKELDKRWKCTIWGQVNWTLIQMPLFFGMAEIIRKMCGTRDGLLGLGLNAFKSKAESVDGVATIDPNPWFQPSLANEGMLWFPDLLTPDPFLPYVVSGLMFTNIYLSKNGVNTDPDKVPKLSKIIRRTLMGVSLMIGPLCQDLPAALTLYWASSTSSVILWNYWLDWKHPSPKDFVACKRPLQILPEPKMKTRAVPAQMQGRRQRV